MTDEYHSYLVGTVSPDGDLVMLDDPIDEGPVSPVDPLDFMPARRPEWLP